ncbi:hypothetical protein ACFV3R_13330 [Streptomyces sp. NPDC059740]|uniref:hypothetical protein n=1 Tax=Streptomyces sp. NPDC059740 TaxID=3346926 RepID=UPI003669C155
MNITGAGTIDRPAMRDPQKQDPEMNPTLTDAPRTAGAMDTRQNRTRELQLIPEAMARAHMAQLLQEAEDLRAARRFALAQRMQRRAERATLRARRALAMAVMQ